MSRLGRYGIATGAALLGMSTVRRRQVLDWCVQAGATVIRFDLAGNAQTDACVDDCLARGLDPMLIVYGTTGPVTGVDNVGGTAAARYLGKVQFFEICNEPDINGWTPNQYADCVNVVSPQIKTQNPNAKIIAGALWKGDGLGTTTDPKAFAVALCNRAAGKFDYLSFHGYDDAAQRHDWNIWDWILEWGGSGWCDAGAHGGTVRKALNDNGHSNVPIISSEGGMPLTDYTLTEQATGVASGIAQVANGRIEAYLHYQMTDDDIRHVSLRDAADAVRPNHASYVNGVRKFIPKVAI